MLQDALCRHEAIRHVDYSPHTYFETHHWLKSAVVLGQPASMFAGGRAYSGYGSIENARTYIEDTLTGNLPGYAVPKDDRELCFDGWEALCRANARPVFFEKSPQILAHWAAISLLLEWMETTEFNVKLIGLVRNPLSVQYSAEKLFSTDPSERQFAWLNTQRNLLALRSLLPEDQLRILRYEDLVSEPVACLDGLCEFLGVSTEPALVGDIHASSREKWRLDEAYTVGLDPAVIRVARGFGYSTRELENPNAVVTPSRRGASLPRRVRIWLNRQRDRRIKPVLLRARKVLGR